MRLYAGMCSDLVLEATHNRIAERLRDAFFDYYRYRPSPNEVEAWRNSLAAISDVFTDAALDDHGVMLEYQLPLTSRRLDCMVLGRNGLGRDNAIIVELKQWSACEESDGEHLVRTFLGGAECETLHPSAQVGQYDQYLKDTHTAFHEGSEPVALQSCAYLHNYWLRPDDPILADKFSALIERFPLFGKDQSGALSGFLAECLDGGAGHEVLRRVEEGKYKPSKKLLEHVGGVIKGIPSYVLLDEQLVIYDVVRACARHGIEDGQKTVVLVRGGPGTGKSVIAINLLADFALEGRNAHYSTGSRAFTETLRKIVGSRASAQFKYFNSYGTAEDGSIDVLICDEAHRIRETSNNRFTPRAVRSGKAQIQELIDAACVSVFFIDDRQNVRPNEIGSSDLIREYAAENHCRLKEFQLEAQFRCAGSDAFVNWVNNTLGLERTSTVLWNLEEEFEFRIFPSPLDLERAIRDRARAGFSARLTAGFCWPWSPPHRNGTLVNDVVIGDFERPWNAKPEAKRLASGIPSAVDWARDLNGINQIGCVYTAQGFEFDYVGVIWGGDLIYDPPRNAWRADPAKSFDRPVKRGGDAFLDLVRNTYRVLLSRGLKGCYVCFLDKNTEHFVRSRLEGTVRELQPSIEAEPVIIEAGADGEPFRRLLRGEVRPFENCVPLYDLDIAAGRFGGESLLDEVAQDAEMQRPEDFTWVELPAEFQPRRRLFVARVVGESMNRRIPNGSWCLFRLISKPTSRTRPIVARLNGLTDPETGRYTVKLYDTEKVQHRDQSAETTRVILRPSSSDSTFQSIVLSSDSEGQFRVIAELVAVLG